MRAIFRAVSSLFRTIFGAAQPTAVVDFKRPRRGRNFGLSHHRDRVVEPESADDVLRQCGVPLTRVTSKPADAPATAAVSSPVANAPLFGRPKVVKLGNVVHEDRHMGNASVQDARFNRYLGDSRDIVAGFTVQQAREVANYLRMAHQVANLFKSIQLYGKLFRNEELLEQFERAEKLYTSLGLIPVLPRVVDFDSSQDINYAAARGLIQRRIPAAPICFHAPGVRRHIVALDRRFKAAERERQENQVRR